LGEFWEPSKKQGSFRNRGAFGYDSSSIFFFNLKSPFLFPKAIMTVKFGLTT